jgi:hypothetical protein
VYPKGRASINAAGFIQHNVTWAGIYEYGGTITPKNGKYLWFPISTGPRMFRTGGTGRGAGRRLTPERYEQQFGDLTPRKSRKGTMMLWTNVRVPARKATGNINVTLGQLRKGTSTTGPRGGTRRGVVRSVPVFVGIPTLTIKKRINVIGAVREAMRDLPSLYVKHFRSD